MTRLAGEISTPGRFNKDRNGVDAHLLERMTENQFVRWAFEHDDIRAEWADGKVEILSPENVDHSALLVWLFAVLAPFVQERDLGSILGSNFFVRFARQKRRRLPDVLFVSKSRLSIVKNTVVDGPPDLIIEVVSPESQTRDRRKKYLEYERAGVREYWIIDPLSRTIELYAPDRMKFVAVEEAAGAFQSKVLPGFFLKTAWLWRRPLPKVMGTLRELGVVG